MPRSTIQKSGKRRKLFSPAQILTQIKQAIESDFEGAKQEYGTLDNRYLFFSEGLSTGLTKKFADPEVNQDPLVSLTYQKFLAVNDHMSLFTDEHFVHPVKRKGYIQDWYSYRDKILVRARSFMHYILTDFDEDEWFLSSKHSSGSSIGVPFRDTSLEAKSSWPVSISKKVVPLMDRYLDYNFQLKSILDSLYPDQLDKTSRYRICEESRATTVEKNDTIRRMIAIEPTGNMFFQQGLMSMMYRRMRAVGLSVERLPESHKMRAWVGSITSNEATIDFSSASDCVSVPLVRYLFPPKWFHSLDMVRSSKMTLNGQSVDLNMFSTMGNAGTFPVETLIFYTLALAVFYEESGIRSMLFDEKYAASVSVFGDDCIVPTAFAPRFIEIAESVGFIVNHDKSCFDYESGFRESCGGDYLHGRDVRPLFLKAPTSTRQSALEPWLYIIANGVLKKYISYFGTRNYLYDREFFKLFAQLFLEYNLNLKIVPENYPDDSGFKVSFDLERFHACYRMRFAPVYRSQHGTYKFQYLRFVYKTNVRRTDSLHYVKWLKYPSSSTCDDPSTEPRLFKTDRRVGGYVVAQGISCHWQLPFLG